MVIQAPANAGSTYFNYKDTHSIVLLAVCDAHYRFTLVDIGDSGRHSDGGVLAFWQALENEELSFSSCRVIMGDEAFPLKNTSMMRPYPGKNLEEGQAVFKG